uniref:Uncharacterized protein n=1 Tax=Siphoviridae sp. ctTic26 TaxID=2823583 RepID=A0A8S5LEN6_9CAUD|nr:MAG TPA: hypothetical protein [Siphoviridae sp. ctTic26]
MSFLSSTSWFNFFSFSDDPIILNLRHIFSIS